MDDELQDELDRLAVRLGRSVSLDGPNGRLLAYSVQSDDADDARIAAILTRRVPPDVRRWQEAHAVSTATGPVRLPANPDLRMSARLCVALRAGGVLHGHLWVVEPDEPLSPAGVAEVAAAGRRMVPMLLARGAPAPSAGVGDRLAELLAALVVPAGPDEAERIVGELVGCAPHLLGRDVRLVVGRPVRTYDVARLPALTRELDRALRSENGLVTGVVGPARLVVLALADAPLPGPGQPWRDRLDAAAGTALVTGAGPVTTLTAPALLAGLERADLAAECAAVDPRLPPDASRDALGIYQLLLDSPDLTAWTGPLAALADGDGSAEMQLSTLETYLDLAGDAQRSATALHLHRTTLYYRLNRATESLGVDLADGLVRTHLHVALKARRLQHYRANATPGTDAGASRWWA